MVLLMFSPLFRLITAQAVFLLFASYCRTTNALQAPLDLAGDFIAPLDIRSYETLLHFMRTLPKIKLGEPVDRAACEIKVPASQGHSQSVSKAGYQLLVPIPASPLKELLEDLPVFFSGEATAQIKREDLEVLRKVLPAAGNHQLLARVLKDTKFIIVIDYGNNLEKQFNRSALTNAMFIPEYMLVILNGFTFYEESFLLECLRNEFSSLNIVMENDCRGDVYGTRADRVTLRGFYAEPVNFGEKMNVNVKRMFMKIEGELHLSTHI
jgi:hypothetical protein